VIVVVNSSKTRSGNRLTQTAKPSLTACCWKRYRASGIARVMKLSEDWLQRYVNRYYQAVPQQVQVQPKAKRRLNVQMDELWSFVDNKGNKQWVWLAIDVETREIVGCYIGDRSGDSATALWESMPSVYRQCAVVYSDYWEAYTQALPSKRHQAVGKESGLTSYIVRASVAKQNGSTTRCANECHAW
jgi:insertion element IS1 protein InsB